MKTTLALLLALIGPSSLSTAHEHNLGDERRLGFWGSSDPADVEAKFLSIYQRCCLQTDETLKDRDNSPCNCPVRTYEGWNGWFNKKSKWEKSCAEGGKVYKKAGIEKAGTKEFASVNDKSIVDIAIGNTDFSTLVELVKTAGLVEALSGKGPFTVFAPTNAAFAKVGTVQELKKNPNLEEILLYHVAKGNAPSRSLKNGQKVETLQGETVEIATDSGVTVNGVDVATPDILANNGVIHVIDAVLLPQEIL